MEKSKLFIFKTNSLSNDQYLLKLNRTDSCLEVYSKVSNSKLNEYYSIRSDFDSSEYTMFEKVDSISFFLPYIIQSTAVKAYFQH